MVQVGRLGVEQPHLVERAPQVPVGGVDEVARSQAENLRPAGTDTSGAGFTGPGSSVAGRTLARGRGRRLRGSDGGFHGSRGRSAQRYTREERQRYRKKVRQCLDVFEQMLNHELFDFDKPMTGLEIELNLVDADFAPALANARVLEAIADPDFQTELAQLQHRAQRPAAPAAGR